MTAISKQTFKTNLTYKKTFYKLSKMLAAHQNFRIGMPRNFV